MLHLIPILARGGAELQLCRLVEAQAERGHRVAIACLRVTAELAGRLDAAGVEVVTASRNPLRFPVDLVRAVRSADIVHSWMYHAFLLAAILRPFGGARHVWAVRRTDPDSPGLSQRTRRVIRLARRWSRARTDGIVYCSQAARVVHEAFGFTAPAATVIPNAISVGPGAAARDGTVERFGCLARWNPDKGIDLLLDAWVRVRDAASPATLVLGGPGLEDGNRELVYAIETRGLEDAVELTGPTADPARFLASLDCLVSASRSEGFPNVVAEAMALGVPVIATDVGGTAEVLGECGRLVPAEDAEALAAAIADHCADPSELRSRASGGPERARQFTVEGVLAATDRFYQRLRAARIP